METTFASRTVLTTTPSERTLRPMGIGLSLVCFGIPGLLNVIGNHVATPAMVNIGLVPFYAQVIPSAVLLGLMLIASVWGYRLEGRVLDWQGLTQRFRLHNLSRGDWLWAIGATIAGFIVYGWFTQIGHSLIQMGWMPLPDALPAWLDPRVSTPSVERFSVEAGGLRGNWLALLAAITTFSLNIIGEEFWWRGYILPRQELAFGKWTWLIHAPLWSVFFHAFKWWDLVGMVPSNLIFVFAAYRTRNTTVAIVMHVATNIGFVAFVLLGVLEITM
ncbi:MAG: CPBP family intramembrane metalloprotease [Chloroflexi bacterium]|nr:CPBP family intramembrane metalloprotease [Chloroflexota bacterium]